MKRAGRRLKKKENKETEKREKMARENTVIAVSKSWLSITTYSTFVRAHTEHSHAAGQSLVIERPCRGERFYLASAIAPTDITFRKLNAPIESSIKASCDGLLCLWNPAIGKHRILNPLTGRSIILPANLHLHTRGFLAFYFRPSTFEYRLLAAARDETSMLVVGQNSWKHISSRLPAFCDHPYTADLNGSLHWIAWKHAHPKSVYGRYTRPPDIIMTFDKEAEVYGMLRLPPPEKLHNRGSSLINFNGKLGLCASDNLGIDFWVMEEDWVKKYSVNYTNACGSYVVLEVQFGIAWLPVVAVSIGDEEELFIDVSVSETLHYLVRWNLNSGDCLVRVWKAIYPRVNTTFSYVQSLFGSFRQHPYNTRAQSSGRGHMMMEI